MEAMEEDGKVGFEESLDLGEGDVAFTKARQIIDQWRFLDNADEVILAANELSQHTKALAIATKGGLGWKTGEYGVAYRREEEDEDGSETLEVGLATLGGCGWTGLLALRAIKDEDGTVSFTASAVTKRGRAPRAAKKLVKKAMETVEVEHGRMMRSFAAAEKLQKKYQNAKTAAHTRAEAKKQDRLLNPEKYKPIRPGRNSDNQGRWTPSSDLQSRRNPAQFVQSSSSTCVSGS
mmetsp:Transcript_38377/g.120305  ORF Transcript_38377/g.120305 Transcript_38377/m.120305 type:complete len:235 (-) Transcript_38377:971-1675(-)